MAYRLEMSFHPMHNPRFAWIDKPAGFKPINWRQGVRADPNTIPKQAKEHTRFKRFPSMFATRGVWTVSADFREIAEELEPGINQFFPIELFRKSGLRIPQRYYLLNVCQSFDAIDIERSNVVWYAKDHGGGFYTQDRGGFRLVMRSDLIDGRHLWCGNRHFFTQNYVSDIFMQKLQKAKLNGWRADYIEEI